MYTVDEDVCCRRQRPRRQPLFASARTVHVILKHRRLVYRREITCIVVSGGARSPWPVQTPYPLVKTLSSEVLPQAPSPLFPTCQQRLPSGLAAPTAAPACAGPSWICRREQASRRGDDDNVVAAETASGAWQERQASTEEPLFGVAVDWRLFGPGRGSAALVVSADAKAQLYLSVDGRGRRKQWRSRCFGSGGERDGWRGQESETSRRDAGGRDGGRMDGWMDGWTDGAGERIGDMDERGYVPGRLQCTRYLGRYSSTCLPPTSTGSSSNGNNDMHVQRAAVEAFGLDSLDACYDDDDEDDDGG